MVAGVAKIFVFFDRLDNEEIKVRFKRQNDEKIVYSI